jgi:hypothetical protein
MGNTTRTRGVTFQTIRMGLWSHGYSIRRDMTYVRGLETLAHTCHSCRSAHADDGLLQTAIELCKDHELLHRTWQEDSYLDGKVTLAFFVVLAILRHLHQDCAINQSFELPGQLNHPTSMRCLEVTSRFRVYTYIRSRKSPGCVVSFWPHRGICDQCRR